MHVIFQTSQIEAYKKKRQEKTTRLCRYKNHTEKKDRINRTNM